MGRKETSPSTPSPTESPQISSGNWAGTEVLRRDRQRPAAKKPGRFSKAADQVRRAFFLSLGVGEEKEKKTRSVAEETTE
jgi:hypothetical protein